MDRLALANKFLFFAFQTNPISIRSGRIPNYIYEFSLLDEFGNPVIEASQRPIQLTVVNSSLQNDLKLNIHECYNGVLDLVVKPELLDMNRSELFKLNFQD